MIVKTLARVALKFVDLPVKVRNWLRYFLYRSIYDVSKDFKFKGFEIFLFGDGEIKLGGKSYIGTHSTINCVKESKVVIGSNVKISHNVRIYTSTDIANQDLSRKKGMLKKVANVLVKDNSWIGANVYIGPGVTIGENSIVGANSVVVRDIPDNEIWGGVPAKLIKVKDV